jgi:hypothetical protein
LLFNLLLLRGYVLKVEEFDFKQENDRHGRLTLPQVVKHLKQQEESLHLEEGFNVLQVLEDVVDVAKALAELLRLIAHGSAIVKQNSVQVDRLAHEEGDWGIGASCLSVLVS